MKQALFAGILLTLFSFTSFSQTNTAYCFGTTGSNVIAYKQGTSCTANPFAFYLINDAGVQASTRFYKLAHTSREVNGIGINSIDHFLYGIEYDRDAACVFSNFHLKRYDSQGNSDDLDALPANAGGTLTLLTSKQILNTASVYHHADTGSYTTGWIVLPVNFTDVAIDTKSEAAVLRWSVDNASEVKEFVVEQNKGAGFSDMQRVWVIDTPMLNFKVHLSGNAAQYRIRAIANNGKVAYSSVVYSPATKQQANAQLLVNPVHNGVVRFVSSLSGSVGYNVANSGGQVLKSGTLSCAKGGVSTVDVTSLRSGVYLLQLNGLTTLRFVVE